MVRSGFIVHRMQMYGKYGNTPMKSAGFLHGNPEFASKVSCKTFQGLGQNIGKFGAKPWKDFQKPLGGSRGKAQAARADAAQAKTENSVFICASALAFRYICHSEYRMRFGRIKFENFVFTCLCAHLSLYLLHEYRMRFGKIKFENFVFTCLCAHLSLYLPVK